MPRDPDDNLVVTFKYAAMENAAKSLVEGRAQFEDVEICEIRAPGMRDVKVFPAHFFSKWITDPFTGGQRQITYAERFKHQYRQFTENAAQTKVGTPLDYAKFLTDARRAELRAMNVYTIEALAAIEGAELKNIGMGGRDMKNQAIALIEETKKGAVNKQMEVELEALRARNVILEEDVATLRSLKAKAEAEFAEMSDTQLKEFIASHTGHTPLGNPNRKTLIRMAIEARPNQTSADQVA
jgi:hypothetical protein